MQTHLDASTGEVIGQSLNFPIGHKENIYGKNNWCRRNQRIGAETVEKFNELYTAKGKVFNHLINSMTYGNFVFYSASTIGDILGMTRQAVHKAKRELLNDGFVEEGINRRTGEKGLIINKELYSKGEDDDNIMTLKEYQKWKEEEKKEKNKEGEGNAE